MNEIQEKYENSIADFDELKGTDIKLNPDYYLHLALQEINHTFSKDLELKDSLEKYIHVVEHIEILAKSAKLINDNYKIELEEFKKSEEYKNKSSEIIKRAALARRKLELILQNVFSKKTITSALTF